jgi:hypothetical protein
MTASSETQIDDHRSMNDFINAHQPKVKGVLSCFDRMIFRGYLPIIDGWAMAMFLNPNNIRFRNLKSFLVEHASAIKKHAQGMAHNAGRPFQYLSRKIRMEEKARNMAARDRIQEGLVCVFSMLQPCRTFSFKFTKGKPFAQSATRKCLHIDYDFMDKRFGLIDVRIQTWFPMLIQVYVNGQQGLARKLSDCGVGYTMLDNVFINIEDLCRAQTLADRLPSFDWPEFLETYARQVNPLMTGILRDQTHDWVTTQSEYATDVLFKSRSALKELYPHLLSHRMLCFGAKEVMSFLGRKLHGTFEGEVITDVLDLTHRRIPGARIKHRVKENWLNMYDLCVATRKSYYVSLAITWS